MESAGPNPKIAIPRWRNVSPEKKDAVQSRKRRAKAACIYCRTRKVRCTGELPRCRNCEKASVDCVYAEARSDRLKIFTEQNHQLITLLRDLSLRVDSRDKGKIDELLNSVGKDSTLKTPSTRSRESGSGEERLGGEALTSGSVGSNKDVDIIDEDMFRSYDSQATGFVGKNSEVQWLRSLKNQVRRGSSTSASENLPSRVRSAQAEPLALISNASRSRQESFRRGDTENVTDSTFYLDRDSLEVDILVDKYELPPTETAERLFESYITTIHTSFPILPLDFERDFKKYINSIKQREPLQPSRKWQAVLNLTFAIGAQYSHLVNAEWKADDRDHIVYMTRALQLLELKKTLVVISAPDLALIQALGLLSMYYLVIGHINRAWVTIGLSLRSALAVGLHLKNEDQSASPNKKETLVRTWWGLHSVESLVSATTGRPCIIATEDCTVPFPQVQQEEQASDAPLSQLDFSIRKGSSSEPLPGMSTTAPCGRGSIESSSNVSVLEVHIRHRLITKKAIELLYSPRVAESSWEQTQKAIALLMDQLDDWARAAFPEGLTLASRNVSTASTRGLKSHHEQFLLAFSLFSAKILITRPCLCRLERRIQCQSKKSANFNRKMAEMCVQAARDLSMLLPDIPNPLWIYQNGPWWSIVHNIMQAISILLLEISYDGVHITSISSHTPHSAKKLVLWLRSMRHNNAVAERAYKVISDILNNTPHALSGINDLLEDEVDPGINQPLQAPISQLISESLLNPNCQEPEYFNSADPPTTSQAQFLGEQHQFIVDDLYPDPYFFSGPSQMPASYENLFMTSFDQLHPLAGQGVADILRNWPISPPIDEEMC